MSNSLHYWKKKVLLSDVDSLVESNLFDLENLSGKSFFITGGTGVIGAYLIKILIELNIKKKLGIKIFALVRSLEKAKGIFSEYSDNIGKNLFFILGDLLLPIDITEKIDFVIHAASPTQSKFFAEKPVETIDLIVNGTKNVLSFAKRANVSKFLFISSMEVYGEILDEREIIESQCFGSVDTSKPRNCYPESKRLSESLCIAYSIEYKLNISIIRLAQTFGCGVPFDDTRVFAQFARSALNRRNIQLLTRGRSKRCYIDTYDAVTAILFICILGRNREVYNVANKATYCSIYDMAKEVIAMFPDISINIEFSISSDAERLFPVESYWNLSTKKIEDLGWHPKYSLSESFKRMYLWWK